MLTGREASISHLIESACRVVAVSPHLDDAVLSAGAYLAACATRGAAVTVVTMFAGDAPDQLSPAAKRHHERCSLSLDAVATRRREDVRALGAIGASFVHEEHLDAIYRHRPDGAWVCSEDADLFARPCSDPGLDDRLRSSVSAAIDICRADLVLGPSGFGGHVDHVLVKSAILAATRRARIPVLLWADQPYAANLAHLPVEYARMRPDHSAMDAKLAAAACYATQLPMLWRDQQWHHALSSAGEAFCAPATESIRPM